MADTVLSGINAPAISLQILALSIGLRGHPVFGVPIENLFYLIGVFVLWFFLGKALDHHTLPTNSNVRGISTVWICLNFSLVGLGALLLFGSVSSYPAFAHTHHFCWSCWAFSVAIGVAWGLGLVTLPGVDLVRGFRREEVRVAK
jgi:hypothetical protein